MCFAPSFVSLCSSLSLSLSLSRARALLFIERKRSLSESRLFFSLPHFTTPVSLLLAPLSFRSIFLLLSSFRRNPATFGTRFHSFTWPRQPARASAIATSFERLIETFGPSPLVFPAAYPKISGKSAAVSVVQPPASYPLVRSRILIFFFLSAVSS